MCAVPFLGSHIFSHLNTAIHAKSFSRCQIGHAVDLAGWLCPKTDHFGRKVSEKVDNLILTFWQCYFLGWKQHFPEDLLSDSAKNGSVEGAWSYCLCGPLLECISGVEEENMHPKWHFLGVILLDVCCSVSGVSYIQPFEYGYSRKIIF